MDCTLGICELKELLDQGSALQVVDVRTPSEFASGHLPTAINIPMEQIEARLQDLRPDSPVVVVCQGGGRARATAALLQFLRNDVSVLDGGTNAWLKAGFPVVVSAKTRWALERQVRLAAGLLVLAGAALSLVFDRHWAYLAALVGCGLTFASLTDICPMGAFLCRMPWNRRKLSSLAIPSQGKTCSLKNVHAAHPDGETILS